MQGLKGEEGRGEQKNEWGFSKGGRVCCQRPNQGLIKVGDFSKPGHSQSPGPKIGGGKGTFKTHLANRRALKAVVGDVN